MKTSRLEQYLKTKLIAWFGFTRNIYPPGFEGSSLFEVGKYFCRGLSKGSISNRASSLAFNFFLALFPAIIFLFTLISYIPIRHFQDQLLEIIHNIVPAKAYQAARITIEDIIRHRRGDLLSFGFLTTLYFSTNGINAMIEGFNRTYHAIETRSFVKQRIIALFLTLLLSILLLISISLMLISQNMLFLLVKWKVVRFKVIYFVILSGKWFIISCMFFLGISSLYYFGPSRKRKWRFFSAGSFFATFLSGIISLGFSYFVNHFGSYNKVYGSIGTLIVILLWIYFNAIAILSGFELNASIHNARVTLPSPASIPETDKRNAFKNNVRHEANLPKPLT